MSAAITQPLKWHGGKNYLAKKIIDLMPKRCKNPNDPAPDDPGWLHYVEPYAGGLAVLLAMDPEGISEVANDRYHELTNFWTTLQDKRAFQEFKDIVDAIPFSFVEYVDSELRNEAPRMWPNVEAAVKFFVRCRQSLAGRMDSFAPLTRNRTRRGMNEQASAWLNTVDGLPDVHARLKRVVILGHEALKVIRGQDGPRTLFYLDPPYLHETRATVGQYQFEMTEVEHSALLNALVSTKHSGGSLEGRFLLSGYRSELYDSYAERFGWNRHDFQIDNKASGGKVKRKMVECVWTNY